MNTTSWLSANRILNVLILSTIVSAGGQEGFGICCEFFGTELFCIPPFGEGAEGTATFGEVEATIHDLSFKGLPLVPDPADPDPKDMTITRAKYASIGDGPTKRMLMRAKKDGAAHRLTYAREFQGAFQSGIMIAVDPDAGTLVDGQSAGYFEVSQLPDPEAEGDPIHMRMIATWDAKAMGLRVSAEDQGGSLGSSMAFPGVTEIRFDMIWNDDGRILQAFPVTPFEGFDTFYFEDVVPNPVDVSFFLSFGADALGKSARLYFAELLIRGATMVAGAGEVAAAMYASVALAYIEAAWIQADLGADPAFVKARLDFGLMFLESAKAELESAMAKGDIHQTAQTKLATRSLKKGMKRLTKGGKLASKLTKKAKPSSKSLSKRANQARWEALLIQAQLFGFKSKSIDKYFATMSVTTPDFGIF